MILVFDLDDTLYDMSTYVKSGYQAVCEHLETHYSIDAYHAFQWMCQQFDEGHHYQMLDNVLKEFGVFSARRVKQCLQVYRTHEPRLQLFTEAKACLARFSQYPLYLVTDGNKYVQQAKIKALGLEQKMRHCYITHRYGIKNAKPSPYCFLKICDQEKVSPDKVIYIGDNPHKDFVGIKPLGFKTIRVKQGLFRHITLEDSYEAHITLSSLSDLTETVLSQWMSLEGVCS